MEGKGTASEETAKCMKLKDEGNELFKKGKFRDACEKYTQCLAIDSQSGQAVTFYSNRAFTHLKQENFLLTINDADSAIKLNPAFAKAYYRRATAFCALNRWREAVDNFKRASQLSPDDKDAKQKYEWALKEKRYREFGSTIGYADSVDQIKEESIIVDAGYAGPMFEDVKEISSDWAIKLMEYLKEEKRVHKKFVIKMLKALIEMHRKKASLVEVEVCVDEQITVIGDVHGQYYDLLNIFKVNGIPSSTNPYLFNGDFVDRGSFSIEVIITLMAWNLVYPRHFFLNRGNHEATQMNMLYGFKGETKAKYDEQTYNVFREFFNTLPLCHLINKKIFVVHGGIPAADGVTLEEIRKINRFSDPPEKGLMADLLWSDFVNEDGRHLSKRGVSFTAGPDVAAKWMSEVGVEFIVRSHEMKEEGYELQRGGKVVTVFSAPNYCDQQGNKGAFVKFRAPLMKPEYTQFVASPHPAKPAMAYASPFMMF